MKRPTMRRLRREHQIAPSRDAGRAVLRFKARFHTASVGHHRSVPRDERRLYGLHCSSRLDGRLLVQRPFVSERRKSLTGRKRQLTGVGSMTAIARHCCRWYREAQRQQRVDLGFCIEGSIEHVRQVEYRLGQLNRARERLMPPGGGSFSFASTLHDRSQSNAKRSGLNPVPSKINAIGNSMPLNQASGPSRSGCWGL
jgi:hypothetical protein